MSIIIIDGVVAAGKSTALNQIQEKLPKNSTKLIISEHLTERYFEDKMPSINSVQEHICSLITHIKGFGDLHEKSRFSKNNSVLNVYIERLFLTFHSRGLLTELFLKEKSSIFTQMGWKQALLVVPEEQLGDRVRSTIQYRSPCWKEYLDGLGGIDLAIEQFKTQQQKMINATKMMSAYIETRIIEVKDIQSDFYKELINF